MTAEASVWNAAGEAARSIETVTWVLIGGGALIFGGVMVLLAVSSVAAAALTRRIGLHFVERFETETIIGR